METNTKRHHHHHQHTNGDNDHKKKKTHIYKFDTDDDEMLATKSSPKRIRKKLCQIFPCVCASVLCLPFGMMLGWPSPTYPYLLGETSPIPISLDQSAMIAGFLMIGNSVGTPFSAWGRCGAKNGIILGSVSMIFGWILMWLAKDIYYLLFSRFLVGVGHGFGAGQLKMYISEITETDLSPTLIQQMPLYTYFGVVLAFCIGPFVTFPQLGIISLIVAIFVLFLAIFLPATPRELIRSGKIAEARKLIEFLSLHSGDKDEINQEITNIRKTIDIPNSDLNLIGLMKNSVLRKNFLIFALLIFFQQFTGPAATIVYSQILFTESKVPNPQYCAIIYSIVFFISNIFGIFTSPKCNKKVVLLLSTLLVIFAMILQIVIVIYDCNVNFWGYTSLIVMLFYTIVHTVGLGNVPFTYLNDLFPKNCTIIAVHYFVMSHSILALLITKIFQVMCERLGFYTPFCLFLLISVIALNFFAIVLPADENKFKSCTKPAANDVNV